MVISSDVSDVAVWLMVKLKCPHFLGTLHANSQCCLFNKPRGLHAVIYVYPGE